MKKKPEKNAAELIEEFTEYYTRFHSREIEYDRIAEDFHSLSGAGYVAVNEVSTDGEFSVEKDGEENRFIVDFYPETD